MVFLNNEYLGWVAGFNTWKTRNGETVEEVIFWYEEAGEPCLAKLAGVQIVCPD